METPPRLLEGKNAVIYGGAGGVGSSVSKAFAQAGAHVFLAGRNIPPLERLAKEIESAGGVAKALPVDALDSRQVEDHLSKIIDSAGSIDISFNLISTAAGIGRSLTSLTEEQFNRTAFTRCRSVFITATAAARWMETQGKGVSLSLTANVARIPQANIGGFGVAGASIESFSRQLALEVGPKGVRVVCLRAGSTPDNPIFHEVFLELAKVGGTTVENVEKAQAKDTALQRLARTSEVASAAVLLASDYASAITATAINVTSGQIVD